MLYRKKPVVIEAWQFTTEDMFSEDSFITRFPDELKVIDTYDVEHGPSIMIETLEGIMRANLYDYIIRGVEGELYPCKPEIFLATYEAVEDEEDCPEFVNSEPYSWRLTRENLFAEDSWINKYPNYLMLRSDSETGAFWIELTTSRGILHVAEGDYIIQADDGELNTVTEAEYGKLHERDVEDEQE